MTLNAKQKKPNRKQLVKKLDAICRKLVLERDGGCVLQGLGNCAGVLQAGHLFSRSYYSTRWNLKNIHIQCAGHNLKHEDHPEVFTLWFIKKFGTEAYEELYRDHYRLEKKSNMDLRNLLAKLEKV